MAKNRKTPDMNLPVWFDGQNINEALFCEELLQERRIIFANGAFFTPDGRVTDDLPLRGEVYDKLKCCAVNNVPRKITNILELLKLEAQWFRIFRRSRIASMFPTVRSYWTGHLSRGNRISYGAACLFSTIPTLMTPVIWLNFLDGLLHAEDVPTLQEFIGYCLIPSNKGQRMMVIKGNGGEGKSQIGSVLSAIFGTNMKDGSIGKISENRFARADLEHILLCVDDDMRMEALRQTNYVKSIVTAQGKMDLERKGKQSYQGWMFARLMAFSNGDLQALYDRSDGFYRRQLVLTTKEKPVDRADDPDLAEKMKAEAEGIFLWAFEGLQRLVANNFKFTESDRIRENREAVKRDNNNIFDFMESEGYIRRKADASISSKDFYEIYRLWCEENSLAPLKARSFSDAMIANAKKFNLEHCNNVTNSAGRRVWGFMGVEAVARPNINGFYDVSPCTYIPEEWQD
ncbi:MAG: phage/plasmid primase, P4 family [Blautia faecis]